MNCGYFFNFKLAESAVNLWSSMLYFDMKCFDNQNHIFIGYLFQRRKKAVNCSAIIWKVSKGSKRGPFTMFK